MSDISGTAHNWQQVHSFQWGAAGAPASAACSHYRCTHCGQHFVHRYNQQPDIWEAMRAAGIELDVCCWDSPDDGRHPGVST